MLAYKNAFIAEEGKTASFSLVRISFSDQCTVISKTNSRFLQDWSRRLMISLRKFYSSDHAWPAVLN